MSQNFLKAVFGDYPQFQDYNSIRSALQNTREKNDIQKFRWILGRFLGPMPHAPCSMPITRQNP